MPIHEWTAQVFRDDEGTLLAGQYRLMIRTEREKARERKKYDDVVIEPYTDERPGRDRRAVRARAAAGERAPLVGGRRGGRRGRPAGEGPAHRHRHDLLARRHGHGPLRREAAAPRAGATASACRASSTRTTSGVPDVLQRVHWDPAYARRAGNPTTFDYGRMRETWLIHLCTDWMGDDAWLWKLDCEFRLFNYVGDTHWMRGTGRRASTSPTATARPSTSTCGARTSGARSRARATPRVLLPEPRARAGPAARPARRRRRPAGRARRRSPAGFAMSLHVERDGAVLRLTLRQPDARNALDDASVAALIGELEAAGQDDGGARRHAVAAPATTSAAASTSSLATRREGERPRVGSIQRRLPAQAHRLIPLVLEVQVPVVCVVRGWAAGIGFQLALAADFRVAARRRAVLGAVRGAGLHARQRGSVAAAADGGPGPGARAAHARAASSAGRRPRRGA